MKTFSSCVVLGLLTSLVVATSSARSLTPEPPRFKIEHLDRTADPRTDFARFAAGGWLNNNTIPADKSRWGGFDELAQFNWAALRGILEEVSSQPQPPGSPPEMRPTG